MITVKQFMQRHALSQIEFQALQNHIKASYPDQTLTRVENIVNVDLFEQYLASIQIATNKRSHRVTLTGDSWLVLGVAK